MSDVELPNGDRIDPDALMSAGWSVTVGELRKAIADLPDDYEVMLSNADVDDIDICNVSIDTLYPPAMGSPGLLVLNGGQVVNSEYAYNERMDAHHKIGGTSVWNHWKSPKEWRRDEGGWA